MANVTTAAPHYVRISPEDHCAFLWITSVICLSYSLCALAARFYAKWRLLGLDDGLISIAQIIAITQYIAFFYAIVRGLGKSNSITTLEEDRDWSRALLGSQILLLVSHTLAKCSTVLLIRRLFTRDFRSCWFVSNVMLGVIILWGLSSIIAVSAGCSPSHILADASSRSCPHDVIRWRGVTVTDVITEVALLAMSAVFVFLIRLSLCQKFLIILGFSFRQSVIFFSISFYLTYARAIGVDHAQGVSIVIPLILQQLLLLASLFSASMPCMKVFLSNGDKENALLQLPTATETVEDLNEAQRPGRSNFSYQMGAIKQGLVLSTLTSIVGHDMSGMDSSRGSGLYSGYAASSRNESRSGSVKRQNGFRTSEEFDRLRMRPEPVKSTTTVYAVESNAPKDENDELNQHMVIRKEMEWKVQTEEISAAK